MTEQMREGEEVFVCAWKTFRVQVRTCTTTGRRTFLPPLANLSTRILIRGGGAHRARSRRMPKPLASNQVGRHARIQPRPEDHVGSGTFRRVARRPVLTTPDPILSVVSVAADPCDP